MESNEENNLMNEMMPQIDEMMKKVRVGDIVKAKVISASDDEVLVDLQYIADGIIKKNEFDKLNDDEKLSNLVKKDDELDVYVLELNDGEGNVLLSKKIADEVKEIQGLEEAYKADKPINIKVTESVKGGVVGHVGNVRVFVPISQLSVNYVKETDEFVNKELEVKIIEFNKEDRKIVASRRVIEQVEVESQKNKLWASLQKGEKRTGKVVRLAKFGAFVNLGGLDGLIHISDMAWNKVNDPSEIVNVGDEVEVYILDFDKEKNRISLGLKDVNKDPWLNVDEKYREGSVVSGKVTKFMQFGAFVELEPGVEGLVHNSEISEERVEKASDVLKEGQGVNVKIIAIDKENKRIKLSIKEASEKPVVDYSKYNEENITTMADVLGDKFKNIKLD